MYFRNRSDCIKQLRLETTKDSKIKKTNKKNGDNPSFLRDKKNTLHLLNIKTKLTKHPKLQSELLQILVVSFFVYLGFVFYSRSLEVSNEYPIELIKTNKNNPLQLMSEDQYENWFFILKTSLSCMLRWFKSEI